MKDQEFLIWLHERLVQVYGESPLVDYLHKLRAIIAATPADRLTVNTGAGANNIAELKRALEVE